MEEMDATSGSSVLSNQLASGGATGGGINFPPPDIGRRGSRDLSSPNGGYEPAAKRVRSWLK